MARSGPGARDGRNQCRDCGHLDDDRRARTIATGSCGSLALRCAVVELLPDTLERQWLWAALRTLIDVRGEEHLLSAPILLPSDEWFPDRWTPDEYGVARLAKRLLGYAGLGHLEVGVRLFIGATEVRPGTRWRSYSRPSFISAGTMRLR